MKIDEYFSHWADAHVVYNTIAPLSERSPQGGDISGKLTLHQKFFQEAPQAHLITANSFFRSLKNNRKIYLAHTTFNFEKIRQQGLFASSGCLVGSVYCTPLTKVDGHFRMHNLGAYIHSIEARMTDRKKRHQTIIIEVNVPDSARNKLIGTDYLRLGEVHYGIYKELEYLLSARERHTLQDLVIGRLKKSTEFLGQAERFYRDPAGLRPRDFLELYVATVPHLPILGYLYFEVIAEYFMLYQDTPEAKVAAARGEFYTPTHKDLMFGLYPNLIGNYSLSLFRPSLKELKKFILKHKLFSHFDEEKFIHQIADRLIFLMNARFTHPQEEMMNWYRVRWEIESLLPYARPLIGHLIHRELRTFGRYPNFYFYFDQYKALQAWNYWNHIDIAIPFNGVLPKGEVGINPAFPDLQYKVYSTRAEERGSDTYLDPVKEIPVAIVPKLIDINFLTMRKKIKGKL